MSSSDLSKLGAEPKKIGHIFRKQNILKITFFQTHLLTSWFPSPIIFKEKNLERFDPILDTEK